MTEEAERQRGFTPTEQSILAVLADGLPHPPDEIKAAIDEDNPSMVAITNLRNHISNIRKKLRPKGHTVVCEIHNRTVHYRHVRLLKPDAYDC
jgi:hypothetical protein